MNDESTCAEYHFRSYASLAAAAVAALMLSCSCWHTAQGGLPETVPEASGMDSVVLQRIEPLVAAAIRDGKMPGCVVCIGRHGQIVYLKAYGNRQSKV